MADTPWPLPFGEEKTLANTPNTELKGGLKSRHLTMMSIAGVIGAALFVGSGKQLSLIHI